MTELEAATAETMHGLARLHLALAKMDGHQIDKRAARFNSIVEEALKYGRMAKDGFSADLAFAGLGDCLDACIIGDPMHVPGKGVCGIVYDWMLPAARPECAQRK